MSRTPTQSAFGAFDEALNLNPLERRAAMELHNAVTDLLTKCGLIAYAFLQGSFARKTMIAPLRDIDKIVILAGMLAGLAPDDVMNRLEAAIAREYPDVAFDRTRHSLKADFGEVSFTFDIVPAHESDTHDDDVMIANRETGGWDRSNTRRLIRVVAQRNAATNGRWIHHVRMAKQAIRHRLADVVPGLHVEAWAYQAVTRELADDEACASIFAAGAALLRTGYNDPTGVDRISDKLKPDLVERAIRVLDVLAHEAKTAVRHARDGEHDAAIAIWHGIFGDCFPAPPASAKRGVLAAAFKGAAVTGAGTVSRHQTGQRNISTRSWRP